MNNKIQLIDTAGQITAVITNPINFGDLPTIAKEIMRANRVVEQVGYNENKL